jgi:hypothetical protein
MTFKKDTKVLILFPPTQINSSRIFGGKVTKIEGLATRPSVTVTPFEPGMANLTFSGLTGRGLGTEAFIVEESRAHWALQFFDEK